MNTTLASPDKIRGTKAHIVYNDYDEKALLIIQYANELKYILVDVGTVQHNTVKLLSNSYVISLPKSIEELGFTKLPILASRIKEVHRLTLV